ncbi:MAG: Gldg family protein [Chthoniobacterales bacterium]|nr:Gldg family protein [Chthoniobacterales bacterium]
MKKRSLETYVYSAIGVATMLVLLVVINVIAAQAKQRIDLTADRAYTLSPGTRAILAKIDTPVQIRFYCTRANSMPPTLRTYAQRVEDLLGEYQQAARGKIEVQKLNPAPDSEAEDSARLDGLQPQLLQNNERVYLGLSVSVLDQKETIPFLAPARERLLEYDISRAIARAINPERPVVGVMSALPVAGRMLPGGMMPQQNERPWVLYSELQRDFTVRNVPLTTDKIPDDVKLLLVIHPKGISDTTLFAIDQFLLRGGKLVAFLDPDCVLDTQVVAAGPMPPQSSSSMDKLLKAWGLDFNPSLVVADLNHMGRTQQGRAPAVLLLAGDALNQEDVLTAQSNAVMVLAGAYTGTPVEGLQQTVLIKSSPNSQLIAPVVARGYGEDIIHNFQPSGTEYALAVRLTGKLKTAFPNGAPSPSPSPSPSASPTSDKNKSGQPPSLKESEKETTIVLFGDVDMIEDQVAVTQMNNPFGGRVFTPNNGNLALAEGAVEQLSGDNNLIAMRSRATTMRPFTVIREMTAQAEARYQDTIRQLESSLSETQRKLNELQQNKQGGQQFILSPEQQQEIANFRKKEATIKAQLKDERRKLRADIDSLENRLKWINIAAMPAAVALAGVCLAIGRSRKRAAR